MSGTEVARVRRREHTCPRCGRGHIGRYDLCKSCQDSDPWWVGRNGKKEVARA